MIDILKKEHNQAVPRPWQTVDTMAQAIDAIRIYALYPKETRTSVDSLLWAESYIDTEHPVAVLKYPGDLFVTFHAFTRSNEN